MSPCLSCPVVPSSQTHRADKVVSSLACRLAAYLEAEPERKKAETEARKAKLQALEKQLGLNAGGSKDLDKDGKPVLSAGVKRARFDDTEYLEQSEVIKENVKSAVMAGKRLLRPRVSSADHIRIRPA